MRNASREIGASVKRVVHDKAKLGDSMDSSINYGG